jgi:hypothetical protein
MQSHPKYPACKRKAHSRTLFGDPTKGGRDMLHKHSLMTTPILIMLLAISPTGCVMNKHVRVTSNPPGAEVYSEGRRIGKTPLTIRAEELMPNWNWDGKIPTRATVTMTKPGYDEYRLEVTEFSVPDEISSNLVPIGVSENFENYLEQNPTLQITTVEATDQPMIQTSQNLDADSANLYSKGYLLVAYSGFSAEGVALESVKEQARKIGAAVVLMQSKFTGVETEYRPVTTHTSGGIASGFSSGSLSTSQSGTAVATGYGPGGVSSGTGIYSGFGSAYFSGSGFTVIPGRSQTEFVPFAKRNYDNQITFWRKRKPNTLGAYCDYVPEEMRQKLQRNTGAFVVAVENASPAFVANILIGDVIVAVGGISVDTPADIESLSTQDRGRPVKVKLIRNGQPLETSAIFP